MPPDADWPIRPPIGAKATFPEHGSRPWPLSFVAQIDFAELQAVQAMDGFPPHGRLLLFCDPIDWPWGAREDQARMRVIFTELPAEDLERRRYPEDFDEPRHRLLSRRDFAFKPRILRPTAWLLPPPFGSCPLVRVTAKQPRAWADEEPVDRAYSQFWTDLAARHPQVFGRRGEVIHQAGGIAFSIQEPVEGECEKFAEDSCPPWWRRLLNTFSQQQRAAYLAGADNWQLVLQIDSDIEVGMEWGDVGRLYLCARRQDLAARRFDRCWMVMQCY